MNRTKHLKGICQRCGGRFEFLADHIGMTVPCPHCQQETELLLPTPESEPMVPRRTVVWTLITIIVLGLGLSGALIALRRAQRWAEQQKHAAGTVSLEPTKRESESTNANINPFKRQELSITAVRLERATDSSLVYATGTLKNESSRQRFGVKVELELSDQDGQKVGAASDYRQMLEPGGEWQFKALVVDSKAVSAKVTAIHEQ